MSYYQLKFLQFLILCLYYFLSLSLLNLFILFWGKFIHLNELRKIGIGLWLMVGAFLIASIIQEYLEEGFNLHIGWQILACLVLTASEVMVSITCLEFAYKEAPKIMKSLVMAIFLLTSFLGELLYIRS